MNLLSKAVWALSLSVTAFAANAQSWPDKPIRFIVPFAPGGNLDLAARIIAPRMSMLLGQQIIVENKPGAGGMIAGEWVARSAPDGQTIFVGANGPLLFSPVIFERPVYSWDKDFTAIGSVSFTGLVLQVHPSLKVDSLDAFLDLAGTRDLLMANAGVGSSNHLVSELLQLETGRRWTTVNYKGNAPALMALLSGEVNFSFEQVSVAAVHINAGKTVPLAVTSRKRDPKLPGVPTFDEQGVKDFEAVTWIGLFSPAKTPDAVIKRLNDTLTTVLREPDVVRRFADMGSEARAMPTDEFEAFVRKEYEKWIPVIKRANITAK